MKITLDKNEKQKKLVQAMGSNNASVSREASEIFAAFIGPVIEEVLMQASTSSMIYRDDTFDADDSPSYPLDLYYDEVDGFVTVWSQNVAGGLPTSHVEGFKEMKISTYHLDSAVSILKKYARRGRLDVISKVVERMTNELIVKTDRNAWATIMRAVAEATSNGNDHLITSTTQDVFQLDDINRLMTLVRRINTSYAGGTPAGGQSRGLTDLFCSPEIKEDVRAFVYQPMNTRSGATNGSNHATSVPLPDGVRESVYNNPDMDAVFGVNIVDILELGVGEKYNALFSEYVANGVAHSAGNFDANDDEVIIGLDLSRDAFIRPVAMQDENGGQIAIFPDDQFVARQKKLGWYAELEEGRICIDGRVCAGLIV